MKKSRKKESRKRLLTIVCFLIVFAWDSKGIEMVLSADVDIDIRSAHLADRSFSERFLLVRNRSTDPALDVCAKAYVRFKLPDDFQTITSVTFTVTRNQAGRWNSDFDVFFLHDGIPGEKDWAVNLTTWNNAPGNDVLSADGFINAVRVGTFRTIGTEQGGEAGDSYSIGNAALLDAVRKDTNGYITLMIARTNSPTTALPDHFWSSRGTGEAPVLTLKGE